MCSLINCDLPKHFMSKLLTADPPHVSSQPAPPAADSYPPPDSETQSFRFNATSMRLDGISLAKTVVVNQAQHNILNNINLTVLPGELVGIAGQSGAGKSTLVEVLNGRCQSQGHVLVNGHELDNIEAQYRMAHSYIPQHDILHRTLTVDQVLRYASRLRLPTYTAKSVIEERINYVLHMVDLDEPATLRHQPVETLSGGEQRRLSIALGLVTEPQFLFLDEPTSGLDPLLERHVMLTLRRLVTAGHSVVLVTHVTANLMQCDYVAFLSNGFLTYFGPPHEAVDFFEAQSFAEIYQIVDQRGDYWSQRFHSPWVKSFQQNVVKRVESSPIYDTNATPTPMPPTVTVDDHLNQCRVLMGRMVAVTLRDRITLAILLLVMPLIAVWITMLSDRTAFVGRAFRPISDTYAAWKVAEPRLMMMGLAAILLGLFGASYELVREQLIFRHEYMINLKIWPYLFSKLFVLAGFGAVQCLLFMTVIVLKFKMPDSGILFPVVIELYITLLLTVIASIALGLMISSLAPSANAVTYLALVALFAQIAFSGAVFGLDPFSEMISYFSISRWSLDAMGSSINMNELGKLTQLCSFDECFAMPTTSGWMGVGYHTSVGHLIQSWGLLCAFIATYMILTYYFTQRRLKHIYQ